MSDREQMKANERAQLRRRAGGVDTARSRAEKSLIDDVGGQVVRDDKMKYLVEGKEKGSGGNYDDNEEDEDEKEEEEGEEEEKAKVHVLSRIERDRGSAPKVSPFLLILFTDFFRTLIYH
jgi:hypothetical protein